MSRALAPFRLAGRGFLAGAALWAAALVGAAPAAADDPAPAPAAQPAASAVSRLNAEETAALVRRFPEWEKKPAVERERIATNVLRLRQMSPAERARFFERLRRAEAAGPSVLAELPERLANYGKLRPDERGRAKEGGRIERAILGAVRGALSAKALSAVDALAPGEQRLLGAGIVAHWRRLAAQGVQGALLPARLRQAASAVPQPAGELSEAARKEHERALQTAMGGAFPAARDAVVADLEAAAAKGREGLLEYARIHAPTPPRTPTLTNALMALERSREFLTDEGRAKVDEVQAALLQALRTSPLKVTDEDIARFRAAKTPAERVLILWDLQQRSRRPGK